METPNCTPLLAEREVDSFGRAIPTKRPLEEDISSRDRRDFRPHHHHPQRMRARGGGPQQRSDWNPPRGQYDSRDGRDARGGRGRGNFDHGYQDRGYGGRYRDERYGMEYRPRSPPRAAVLTSLRHLQPMKSFKHFVSTQADEVSVEIYQKRYNEYQLQYLQDASNYFFEKSKCEEWFRERYDPLVQQMMEKEAQDWSSKESKRVLDLVSSKYVDIAPSFQLNTPVSPNGGGDGNRRQPFDSSSDTGQEAGDHTTASTSVIGTSHYFDGHYSNTIYLSGIPATCTKLLLTQAIKVAVAGNSADIKGTVERVCLAWPTWSAKELGKFDRNAWVVFSPQSDMHAAVKCLREVRIPIPGPVDPNTGNNIGGIEFKMLANIHTHKSLYPLPNVFSRPDRVAFDVVRAVELGYLLDKERGVPEEHNLQSVLQAAATHLTPSTNSTGGTHVDTADIRLSDMEKLDITIAYLRRVHFFVYYSGKRFRDEAHLLTAAPTVILRRCISEYGRNRSNSAAGTEDMNAADDDTRRIGRYGDDEDERDDSTARNVSALSRRGDDDDEDNDDDDDDDTNNDKPSTSAGNVAVGVEDGEETKEPDDVAHGPTDDEANDSASLTRRGEIVQADLSKPYKGRPNASTYHLDRRIEECIRNLRQRVERLERQAQRAASRASESGCDDEGGQLATADEGDLVGSVDEEDAKAIAKAQEKVMEQVTHENCESQADGRARCGIAWCAKLFKGKDFLQKHLRNRHPEVAMERLVRVAEKYMLRRFNAKDLIGRNLPAVEVEAHGGVEIKSVREVFESAQDLPKPPRPPQPPPPPPPYVPQHHHAFGGSSGRGRGLGRGGGGRGRGDMRWQHEGGRPGDMGGGGGNVHAPRSESRLSGEEYWQSGRGVGSSSRQEKVEFEYQAPKAEDNNARVLHSYRDVDTPTDVKVELEYGVAVMPPPKKRRLLPKT